MHWLQAGRLKFLGICSALLLCTPTGTLEERQPLRLWWRRRVNAAALAPGRAHATGGRGNEKLCRVLPV